MPVKNPSKEQRQRWNRTFYEKHPERRREANQRQRQRVLAAVLEAKAAGCSRCSEDDPDCLDFHHVRDKEFGISEGVVSRGYGVERVKAEIEKCIVLCANCHRKEHARQRRA